MARCGLRWREIDAILLTHFHADHFGELPALVFAMKYGAREPRSAPLDLFCPAGTAARLAGFAAALGDWVTNPGFPLNVREITPGSAGVAIANGVALSACKTPHTDESMAYAIETRGRRLVYTGDTGPSDAVADWATGCDLLLAECSLPDTMAMDIHLTPASVGRLAGRAQAKRLVLTHLYPPVEGEDIAGIVGRYYQGPVAIARDGDRFEC